MAIIVWTCLCRVMHGLASSTMQTTAYAVGTNDFPERKELIVGGIEAMTGVGNIVGPLLSSVLYEKFGFGLAFGSIGLTIVVVSLFFLCYFPRVSSISADETEADEFTSADREDELAITPRLFELDGNTPVSTLKLLKDPRVTMAALGASLCYF